MLHHIDILYSMNLALNVQSQFFYTILTVKRRQVSPIPSPLHPSICTLA